MTMRSVARLSLVATVVLASAAAASSQSSTTRPAQRIRAQDGDVIFLDDDARVKILRRRQAVVRAVYNAADRWVILVIDYAPKRGEAPDGRPDATHEFRGVTGDWPLGERWEGGAVVENYAMANDGGPRGMGLRTAQGFIQFFAPPAPHLEMFKDPEATAVIAYTGSGGGTIGVTSFDDAETRALGNLFRNLAADAQQPAGRSSTVTSLGAGSVTAVTTLTANVPRTPSTPIRVGGSVAPPTKIYDVPPVLPAIAAQANVRGTVILELTIGTDGSVTNAQVLRSIPLLDAAALDAARQWRYEPVLLNGNPVPVLITAVVRF